MTNSVVMVSITKTSKADRALFKRFLIEVIQKSQWQDDCHAKEFSPKVFFSLW